MDISHYLCVRKVSAEGFIYWIYSFFKQVALARNNPRLNVGKVELASDAIMLAEAVVVAEAPEVTAVADTLVYNSSAYRVPEGSALEELVKKLPGLKWMKTEKSR